VPGIIATGKAARALRWLGRATLILLLIALLGLSLRFGAEREYRFEVASILITWPALIIGGSLLAPNFRD
jgi:hypothetical protein